MSVSTENISMVSESGGNNEINTSIYNIATVDKLPESMQFVNERMESMGLGNQLKFDSSEPSDVVEIVNCFYRLLEKIRLQKKQLEENRSAVRKFQKETETVNSEKQQLTRQIQQLKETNQREISQLQKSLSDQQSQQRILEQQLKDVRTKANEAINKFNLQSVTIKQKENEIATLKSRLLNEMNKQPSKRRVFNLIGEECEDCIIDVNKEFENKICASYEKQVQNLRNQIHELEGIVNKTNPIMNEMTTKNNEILQNFNSEPVRRVYPSSDQSIIYETPQYQFVSLFGNGEDIVTFTKSKYNQYEEQLKKISEANEKYSSTQLRDLLKEAQDIIKEQLGLLHRFVDPQDQEDALSFLDEYESENHEVDNMDNEDNMNNMNNIEN